MTRPRGRRATVCSAAMPLLIVLCPGCERLNPAYCLKPDRCPAGQRCDPTTNSCVPALDIGAPDLPQPDRSSSDQRRDRARDATPACVGGWGCVGTGVGYCRDAATGAKLRECPAGQCLAGHCVIPATAKTCTTHQDCPAIMLQVCTFLLESGKTPKEVCVPAVAGQDGPAPCVDGLECATGLCSSQHRCYHACDGPLDCPSGFDCVDVSLIIEGVDKTAKSCSSTTP